MGALAGVLGLNSTDSQLVYVNTIGQRAIYDATTEYLSRWNEELNAFVSLFVEETTEAYTERYMLPGSGYLERRGRMALPSAIKATGSWDVGYPLEDFGAQVGGDDIAIAYMTLQDLERHLQTVLIKDMNTMRFEMLRCLFNSSTRTFVDETFGSITVQPLANGDSVLYPPIQGTITEATATYYAESGYASSSISDSNNPFETVGTILKARHGSPTGGAPIFAFHNSAQNAKIKALTNFVPYTDARIIPSTAANRFDPVSVPPNTPGEVIGITDSCVNIAWDWIPANYILFLHTGVPAPLKMRVDLQRTGLPRGLQLVSTSDSAPFTGSFWRHRFGFGCGNRLAAYVLELGTGGSYTVPTAYNLP